MTDTQPDPTPSATLGKTAPLDTAWPEQLVEPYRNHLIDRADEAHRRATELTGQYQATNEKLDRELDALRAKIPDVGDDPTLVEWLTRRAAQAEYDLVQSRQELAIHEIWVKRQVVKHEGSSVEARVAQLDHLTESGPYTAGNDTQLAIVELDLQESALQLAHEKAVLDIARQRLELSKRMHREINTGLRAAKRAEERAKK